MSILVFDINAPDPGAAQYGPNVTQIRDNLATLTMYAAANGGRLPDFNSTFAYTGDNLTEVILTNKTYTSIKIKITYSYTGSPSKVNKESYYFDKGLGGGYELVSNGVITYGYSGDKVVTATAANT